MRAIFCVTAMAFMLLISCSGQQQPAATDTLNEHGTDSMPVLNPKVTDTNSTIITPPVNDSNVVVPDSNGVR